MNLGDFGLTDYTPLMTLVPRSQNLLEELGIFGEANTEYLDSEYAKLERENAGLTKMAHKARGADRNFIGNEKAQIELLQVPFAPLDSITKPQEVEAFRQYGTEDAPATVEALVQRKIAHIQRSHARLVRDAQYTALVENKVYAKKEDGSDWTSMAKDFSALWGKARGSESVDLTDATTDPFEALGRARAQVIAKAGDDGDQYDMMALCNTAQFDKIVSHALVQDAYANYPSEQEPLRRRLSGNRNNRTFRHKGLVIVEDISGKIANAKMFVFPMGMEMTSAAYAPADTIEHVGKISEGSYLFMKEAARSVTMESEVAYAAFILRPELITDVAVTL